MRFCKRFRFVTIALCILATFAISVSAIPLTIQVISVPHKAAGGNAGEAIVLVYLANEDGTPNTNAEIPKQGADPNGGVELKGSKWSFETIATPESFKGSFQMAQETDMKGQLRIMQVAPFFNPRGSDPRAGLYVFRILPRYGPKGRRKGTLPWVSGEYTFRISYKDGSKQGTTLGVLTIR